MAYIRGILHKTFLWGSSIMARQQINQSQSRSTVTNTIAASGAAWSYVPITPGASRMRISVDAKYSTASAGTAIQLAFNSTNSGSPSNQASLQDYYVSNTATLGRDNAGTSAYFARTYSNAANFTSHIVAEVSPNSSYSHGASTAGTAMEAMTCMATNSTGTSWMQSPYLGIYLTGTGTVNYTIEYFY